MNPVQTEIQSMDCWRALSAIENVNLNPMDRAEIVDLFVEVERLRGQVETLTEELTTEQDENKELQGKVDTLQELADNVDEMDNAIMELDGRAKKGLVWEIFKEYLDQRISNDAKSGRLA